MEFTILIVWVLLGILQIVMIIKFFQIAADVREVKSKMSSKTKFNTKKEIYKWIVAGETEKAKDALFNAIASTPEFDKALQGINESYKIQLQESLNKEFSKELSILGIKSIDLSSI